MNVINQVIDFLFCNIQGIIGSLETYMNIQDSYFIIGIVTFIIAILIGLCKKVSFRFFLDEIVQLLGISILGTFVSYFITLELKYSFAPKVIFVIGTAFLLILFTIECIKYSKTKKLVLIHGLKIYKIAIKFEVFFLSLLKRLELIEFLLAFIFLIAINILIEILKGKKSDKEVNNQKNEETNDQKLTNSKPIIDKGELFDSRKKQLILVKKELQNKFNEINSVMIEGDWGTGKTSFVNVLKEELKIKEEEKAKEVKIINVQCGVECDLKQVLNSISSQFETIMNNNKIYVKNNSIIHKYFKNIYYMVEGTDYHFIRNIGHLFQDDINSFEDLRQEMNEIISVLNMNIYIFIDDLDRVLDETSRMNMLKVIYESINLDNCLTVFTVDIDKFLGNNDYLTYIEKYVDHTINLTNVSFEEIVDKYKEKYFPKQFTDHDLNKNLMKDRNIPQTIKNVYNDILKEFEKQIDNPSTDIEQLKQEKDNLISNCNNPRKVKQLLKTIKNMLEIVNVVWFEDNKCVGNDYTKLNWIVYITRVAFFNVFYKKQFDYIYSKENVIEYRHDRENKYIYENVLKGVSNLESNKKVGIYQLLIFQIYTMDSTYDKTLSQSIKDELKSNELKINHFQNYLFECIGLVPNLEYTKNVMSFFRIYENEEFCISRFLQHYTKNCIQTQYLNNNDFNEITKYLIKETQLYLEKKPTSTNKISLQVNEIIDAYLTMDTNGLNELIYYVSHNIFKDEEYYNISNINNLNDIIKCYKITNKKLQTKLQFFNSYFSKVKEVLIEKKENEFMVKTTFLDVIILESKIIEIVQEWNTLLDYSTVNLLNFPLPIEKDLKSLENYFISIRNAVDNNAPSTFILIFDSLQLFVESIIIDNEEIDVIPYIRNALNYICFELKKGNIIDAVGKEEWDNFLLEIYRKLY